MNMPSPDNRAAAEEYVATCINNGDANAADFDVERIADTLHAVIDGWNIDSVDADTFWTTVEANAR